MSVTGPNNSLEEPPLPNGALCTMKDVAVCVPLWRLSIPACVFLLGRWGALTPARLRTVALVLQSCAKHVYSQSVVLSQGYVSLGAHQLVQLFA